MRLIPSGRELLEWQLLNLRRSQAVDPSEGLALRIDLFTQELKSLGQTCCDAYAASVVLRMPDTAPLASDVWMTRFSSANRASTDRRWSAH